MEELNKQLEGIQIMLAHLEECILTGKSSEQYLSQIENIQQHIDQMKAGDQSWGNYKINELKKELGIEGNVTNEEPKQEGHFGEEQAADLKKEMGTEGTSVNKPDTKDTSLSEQERWLIEALKDDPHDDRWED